MIHVLLYLRGASSTVTMKTIQMGVLQRSFWSTPRLLLYILYVDDFQNAVVYIPRLYTDYTCLLVHGNSSEKLQYSLKTEIEKISQWMIVNCLTINPQKSSIGYFLFTQQYVIQSISLSLEVNINHILSDLVIL